MLLPVTPRVTGNTEELKSSLWDNWKVDEGEIWDVLLPEAVPFLVVSAGMCSVGKNPPFCSGSSTTHLYQHRHLIISYREKLKLSFPSPQLLLEFFRIKL